jgi:diguanylate cyclase (GGDEF)-like protein/PAS domain S-box-containing protein
MTGIDFGRKQEKLEPMLLFKHFMNDSLQPFMIGYKDGRIIDFNRSFQNLLGYSRDELLTMHWTLDLTPKEWQQVEEKAIQEHLKSGQAQYFEKEYYLKNGERLPVEMLVHSLPGEGEYPGYLYFFIYDISHRKQAEERLLRGKITAQKQVEYLNTLLDNMNELFYTYDREGKITFANQKSLDVLGYKPEEVLAMTIWDFVPERHRAYLEVEFARRLKLKDKKPDSYLATVLHKDGSERIFRLNAAPIIEDGISIGEMVLAQDITEQRQMGKALKASNEELRSIQEELTAANEQLTATEEELRQQLNESEANQDALANAHQQLEVIFNFLPDPAFVVDAEGRVEMWNLAMEELTGVKAREILGKGNREYSVVFYGNRRPMLIDLALGYSDYDEEEYLFLKQDRGIFYGESLCTQIGNNGVYISGKSAPLYDRKGKLIGAITSLRDVTENRAAQKALQDSEEKYRNIIETIEDGYFEVDLAGNFTFFNPWLLKVLGYSANELHSQNYQLVMDKENGRKVYRAFNRVFKTGQSVKELDWQVLKKDGTPLFVETTVLPIKDNMQVIGFRGIVRDISERKQAEAALRQSENLYRTIFETTGTATIIIEEDMIVSLMNSEMERLTGYSKEEVEGKMKWTTFVAPEDQERMISCHQRRRESPDAAPRNYEFRLRSRDGSIRETMLTIAMIPGTSQSVTSILDITNRKMFEEALAISEARYRGIVEDQAELVCRFLPGGELTFVNETYCRYFNKERWKLLGKDFRTNFLEEDLPLVESEIAGLSYEKPITTVEHRVVLEGGEIRWQQWTHRALFNEKGLLVDYQSVGRDITGRKEAEDQLNYLSTHDALTGLYNRRYFEEQMSLLENGEYDPVGLVMCDVDGLKIVNDTLGHEKGDLLLKTVANLINQCFRKNDIVARVGGDEFAILLPETSEDTVKRTLERIRKKVQDYNENVSELPLSISIGYAVRTSPEIAMSSIFEEADNNMYREKLHSRLSARSSIVHTMMRALEARDFITEGHADRLQVLVARMAQALELSDRIVNDLRLLAQFHDIGKVGVPDSILFKEGPLSKAEYSIMKRHCEIGHRIALSAPELVIIADWILKHHEWWNGKGYPLGLEGEDIPLECRILAIADAYDAMTSDRPYRQAMDHEQAIDELKRYAGIQFDPELVELFLEVCS